MTGEISEDGNTSRVVVERTLAKKAQKRSVRLCSGSS
jgi:hypothetical protein